MGSDIEEIFVIRERIDYREANFRTRVGLAPGYEGLGTTIDIDESTFPDFDLDISIGELLKSLEDPVVIFDGVEFKLMGLEKLSEKQIGSLLNDLENFNDSSDGKTVMDYYAQNNITFKVFVGSVPHDPTGEPYPPLDENGNPPLDENGNPLYDPNHSGWSTWPNLETNDRVAPNSNVSITLNFEAVETNYDWFSSTFIHELLHPFVVDLPGGGDDGTRWGR